MRLSTSSKDPETQMAMYVAMVIRNAIEDFHVRHLSDAQMKELNPLIRNAVYTALRAAREATHSAGARAFFEWHRAHIPEYWEQPNLLEGYVRTLEIKYRRR